MVWTGQIAARPGSCGASLNSQPPWEMSPPWHRDRTYIARRVVCVEEGGLGPCIHRAQFLEVNLGVLKSTFGGCSRFSHQEAGFEDVALDPQAFPQKPGDKPTSSMSSGLPPRLGAGFAGTWSQRQTLGLAYSGTRNKITLRKGHPF